MKEALFGSGSVLSSHVSHGEGGLYASGGSDPADEDSVTASSAEELDAGAVVNGVAPLGGGGLVSEDTAVEGVAIFGDVAAEGDVLKSARCCAECGSSTGPFLVCGGCELLYHSKCLMQCFLPVGDGVWKCPQCQWKLINAGEMPVDTPLAHGELSDDSQSGYEGAASPTGNEEMSDEPSEPQKEVKPKVGRGSGSPLREPVADPLDRKRKKPVSEGSNFQTKINVGYGHQVPFTPAFFLDDSYNAQQDKFEWARLMYSPYHLEKIRARKLQEGAHENVIKNEFELAEFIQLCAQSWKSNPGWHPFSPEFAYKILHFADYDPKKALKVMNDPNFNFLCVCDPPTRRYDNKWKPKDRRGQVPTSPYPPPVTLRGYLLRRHDNSK